MKKLKKEIFDSWIFYISMFLSYSFFLVIFILANSNKILALGTIVVGTLFFFSLSELVGKILREIKKRKKE